MTTVCDIQHRLDRACPIDWQHPQAQGLVADYTGLLNPFPLILDSTARNRLAPVNGITSSTDPSHGKVFNLAGVSNQYAARTLAVGFTVPFSLSCWAFPTLDPSPQEFPLGLSANSNVSDYALLNLVGSAYGSKVWAQYSNHAQGAMYAISSSSYSLNTWIHCVAVFESARRRIFINGRLDGSDTTASTLDPVMNLINFGCYYNNALTSTLASPNSFFTGLLNTCRIYNRALAPSEIWSLYAPDSRWSAYRLRSTRLVSVPASPPPSLGLFRRTLPGIHRAGSRGAA